MRDIEKYYKNTEDSLPHDNVIEFIKIEKNTGKAIELGCGAGRDTIYLIKNGWKVISIDRENTKPIIEEKLDDKELNKFTFIQSEFENINLENNNLVIANYSLPFCKKDKFNQLWDKIVNSIDKERIFCRKFFWKK